MLELKNLTVKVGDKTILHKINYSFSEGKTYAIMGPNGSGKSTLANAIMGHPEYFVDKQSKIIMDQIDISKLGPDKRADLGIFLSFQQPLSLSGVKVFQLLRLALSGKIDPLVLNNKIEKYAELLKISPELLQRSLNDGASGGEKKKLELLQAAILQPKYAIFDEIDTGVDVDALKTIAQFMHKSKGKATYIVITHYNRILKYIRPDYVLIINKGRLVETGDYKLAERIEEKGYKKLKSL